MKRAIFLGQLLAMNFVCQSQNLVINPQFDDWDKVNKPSGWMHVEKCLKDSSVVNSMIYSCLHSGGTTTTSDLGQTIAVSPGKIYLLSLYYKTGIPSTGNGSRIWCYWKDTDGNSLTDPLTDDIIRPSKYLKSDTWSQFGITVTAPEMAASFYLELRTNSNSSVYWDDIIFEETVATGYYESPEPQPKVYPNPVNDYLIICNIQNANRIDIQSLTGVTEWSSTISGESRVMIPVSGFARGVYIISIASSGKLITRKFIKN